MINRFISLKDKNNLSIIVHNASILSIAVFIPYYMFTGVKTMMVHDIIMVSLLLLVSIFFKNKLFFWGKLLNLTIITIYLFDLNFIFIDYHTNTNLFFFLLIIVALMITDYTIPREKYMAIAFSIINTIFVFFSEVVRINPVFYLPEKTIHFISVANTTIFALSLSFIFFFYNYSILRYQKELQFYATTDPLTGLLNRRSFLNRGKEIFADSINNCGHFSILLFDIDFFKSINDKYGHPAGDKVLKELSKIIQCEIKSEDLFGRYGGEEFVLLLKHVGEETPMNISENLRKKISDHSFIWADNIAIHLSVSIGICTFENLKSTHCHDLTSMLDAADKALYLAKDKGRNCSVQI